MLDDAVSAMPVGEIMNRWPSTINVFIELRLHCVGCPVAAFQTLADAAREHGIPPARLADGIAGAIAGEGRPRAGP